MIGIGEGRERGFEIKLTSDKGYDQESNSLIIFFQKNLSNESMEETIIYIPRGKRKRNI